MLKRHYKSIYCISVGVIINIFILITIWNTYIVEQNKVSNHNISNTSIAVGVRDKLDKQELEHIFSSNSNLKLSQIFNENKLFIIAVLQKELEDGVELQQGRYFKETDYFTGRKVAVISSYLFHTDYVNEENGEQYIELAEESYQVIGVIDSEKYPTLSNDIYINMDSYVEHLGNTFIIDCGSKQRNEKLYDQLKQMTECKRAEKPVNAFDHGLNNIGIQQVLFCVFLLFLIVVYSISNIYYFRMTAQELRVSILFGRSSKDTVKEFIGQLATIFLGLFLAEYCFIKIVSQFVAVSFSPMLLLWLCCGLFISSTLHGLYAYYKEKS